MQIHAIDSLPSFINAESDRTDAHRHAGTKSRRATAQILTRRSIPEVIERAVASHDRGMIEEAEAGYRCVLDVDPADPVALRRLGEVLAAKGDFAGAKLMFRSLTEVRPQAGASWLRLGWVCEQLEQHQEAVEHYLEFMRLEPNLPDGFVGLARCLVRLGRIAEVNLALTGAVATRPSVRRWRDESVAAGRRTAPDSISP